MKLATLVVLGVLLMGCTTVPVRRMSFPDAVHKAVQCRIENACITVLADGSCQNTPSKATTNIVVVLQSNNLLVADRPTTIAELETIRSVPGLPVDPAVEIRAYQGVAHADVKAVMDALCKAGVWRIRFVAIRDKVQNDRSDGIVTNSPYLQP